MSEKKEKRNSLMASHRFAIQTENTEYYMIESTTAKLVGLVQVGSNKQT